VILRKHFFIAFRHFLQQLFRVKWNSLRDLCLVLELNKYLTSTASEFEMASRHSRSMENSWHVFLLIARPNVLNVPTPGI
jgi:hypothetical protein